MRDKFKSFYELCECVRNKTPGCDLVVIQDLSILGDTVQEVMENIKIYFEAGGKRIETTDGIKITQ